MITRRRAVLYLALVFLLGLALGALGAIWAGRRVWSYEGYRHRHLLRGVEWLDRELKLTGEQRQQLEVILDEMGKAYGAIRQRTRPEYEAVRQQGREKIRAILTPEQRGRFEELVRQIDQEEAEWRQQHQSRKRAME